MVQNVFSTLVFDTQSSRLTNDESEASQTKQMKKFVLYEPSPDYHSELIINDALKKIKQ